MIKNKQFIIVFLLKCFRWVSLYVNQIIKPKNGNIKEKIVKKPRLEINDIPIKDTNLGLFKNFKHIENNKSEKVIFMEYPLAIDS